MNIVTRMRSPVPSLDHSIDAKQTVAAKTGRSGLVWLTDHEIDSKSGAAASSLGGSKASILRSFTELQGLIHCLSRSLHLARPPPAGRTTWTGTAGTCLQDCGCVKMHGFVMSPRPCCYPRASRRRRPSGGASRYHARAPAPGGPSASACPPAHPSGTLIRAFTERQACPTLLPD